MTADEAKALVLEMGGEDGFGRMEKFLALVIEENQRQNLIAPSTIETIWTRHAADSVQLVRHAGQDATTWLDIGTGGGFPGLAVALVAPYRVTLLEPRRRRAEFLATCVERLGVVDRVTVDQRAMERIEKRYDVISARAVASVRKLLHAAVQCGRSRTRWILPRGRLSEDDQMALKERRAVFHVEQSLTDPASSILIITELPE